MDVGRIPTQIRERLECKAGQDAQGGQLDRKATLQKLAHALTCLENYTTTYDLLCEAENWHNRKSESHWGALPRRCGEWGSVSDGTKAGLPCRWQRRQASAASLYRDPGNWSYCVFINLVHTCRISLNPMNDPRRTLRCVNRPSEAEACGDTMEAYLGRWLQASNVPMDKYERVQWDCSLIASNPLACSVSRTINAFQYLEDAVALTPSLAHEKNPVQAAAAIWEEIMPDIWEFSEWMTTGTFEGSSARSKMGQARQNERNAA